MKAYSYVRFSHDRQKFGHSLDRQLEATRDYCKEFGHDLDEKLTFRDLGVSAYKADNFTTGMLGNFIKAIDSGRVKKPSCLVVENLDRISRAELDDATEIFKKILRKGINIVTLTDKKVFTPESLNNPFDLILAIMYFFRAHDESLQKSKRIRHAWSKKRNNAAQKPITAVCPSWLKYNKVTHEFTKIPHAVKAVERIFELSRNGLGNLSIAKLLNQEKLPGIGRVNSWHGSVVARILTNRAVLGEFQPMTYVSRGKRTPIGEPIPNYFPQIISEKLFSLVSYRQKQRKVRGSGRRGIHVNNLFTHICKCGYCGASMIYVQKRDGRLVCENARRGYKCPYVGYPYDEFESSFLTYVKDLDLKSILNPPTKSNQSNELEEVQSAIAQLETELQNVADAIAKRSASPVLLQKLDKLEAEKLKLNARLKQLTDEKMDSDTPVVRVAELKGLIEKISDKNSNDLRLAVRESIRSCIEFIAAFPYEKMDGIKPEQHSWSERRKLTKQGWDLMTDKQRVLRGYFIRFKNSTETQFVNSHPKYDPHHFLEGARSTRYAPIGKDGLKKVAEDNTKPFKKIARQSR